MLPLAESLDHVGVLARSVALAAAVDRLFVPTEAGGADPARRRRTLGVHRVHMAESEPVVRDAVAAAIDRLAVDHAVVDVELPSTEEVIELTNTIMFFEAAQTYGPLATDPDSGLGDDVRARLETGLAISTGAYARGVGVGVGVER